MAFELYVKLNRVFAAINCDVFAAEDNTAYLTFLTENSDGQNRVGDEHAFAIHPTQNSATGWKNYRESLKGTIVVSLIPATQTIVHLHDDDLRQSRGALSQGKASIFECVASGSPILTCIVILCPPRQRITIQAHDGGEIPHDAMAGLLFRRTHISSNGYLSVVTMRRFKYCDL